MLFDLSAGDQEYVEDCEICCNPITVHYEVDGDQITLFEASKLE